MPLCVATVLRGSAWNRGMAVQVADSTFVSAWMTLSSFQVGRWPSKEYMCCGTSFLFVLRVVLFMWLFFVS